MNDKPPTKPNPIFTFQGSGLQLMNAAIAIGPFLYPAAVESVVGLKYAEQPNTKGVREISLRPMQIAAKEDDPCTVQLLAGYQQNGIEWDMIFHLVSDQSGGMNGTAVALDVICPNGDPEIDMSLPKFVISQGGFGELKRNVLPEDYQASLSLKFWSNNNDIPADAWVMLKISYLVKKLSLPDQPNLDTEDIVPVIYLKLYPSADTVTPPGR